ncbi:uncharacterized protein SPPG_06092 [Spizellomyces punctatus DAOM BR117]|uniref:CNH domain-containing protein n=1 Tax=Spizellomyces punctatus (strain DAOM BR117) TaxID=645134 RepID=A0A0L0HBS7_SPIPD|nr:uncharacterized protein SPPG_06092 [Spizellomyces punctatus DAOM BR117]KNC98386.1 hypothetical protein SPPG_06092 [Spizellomyces punctatus DAOM BR117]|eukprot:XP_016606426.1 hypothetical protein SPPG_06092 [Spizellomyces punctatus DAOM BR117]
MSRPSFTPFKVVTLAQDLSLDEVTTPLQRSSIFGRAGLVGHGGAGASSPSTPGSPNANKATIVSLELCDSHLYVGTSDGHIFHYTLERESAAEVDAPLKSHLNVKKFLGFGRRHVDAIIAVPTESKLVVLCDASANFFELDTLSQVPALVAQPVKAITCFCADRYTQSPMPMSFAKRRTLVSGHLGDMLELEKEISLPDGAIMMVRYESRICAADQHQYKLINIDNGLTIPLFPYDRTLQKPLAIVVSNGEYLLATATPQGLGLGLFISPNGEPIRGTLEWPAIPKSLAFHFPYVAALLHNNCIEIHNIFNQKRVQTITLPASSEPKFLVEATFEMELPMDKSASNGSIRLLVGCKETVLALRMDCLERQVDDLLELRSVEAAVQLAETMMQGQQHESTDAQRLKLSSLYQRAGLIYFKDTLFEEAFELFTKGEIESERLLKLFPDVAGSPSGSIPEVDDATSEWVSQQGTIDEIVSASLQRDYPDADPETLGSFRDALVGNAKEMLGKYLRHVRETAREGDKQKTLDTALLKLYVETDRKRLYQLLSSENCCDVQDAAKVLGEKERHYALSLLYEQKGMVEDAFALWLRMASNEVTDEDFPGLPLLVNHLTKSSNKELILKYSKRVLELDPQLAAQIFTTRTDELFSAEEILEQLRSDNAEAYRNVLEFMITNRGDTDEQRHTSLAMTYIEQVEACAMNDSLEELENEYRAHDPRPSFNAFLERRTDNLSRTYSKLLTFLTSSRYYSPSAVATKLNTYPGLHAANATVLAQTNKHEEALRILVLNLNDHATAEQYCLTKSAETTTSVDSRQAPQQLAGAATTTKKDDSLRRHLLFTLLQLYLESGERGGMIKYAVQLLNRHSLDFDVIKVLDIIPNHWSLDMLSGFLTSSMRRSLHSHRESHIVRALSRGDHFKVHTKLIEASQLLPPVYIPVDGVRCVVCGKVVSDPTVFARLPAGGIVHLHCNGTL